jgi:anti-sigma-K factor RskA
MSTPPNNSEALIIAYLTGQASEAETVQFQTRIGTDSEFQDQVERLEAWLAPLNLETEDMSPPEGLLASIMSDIETLETATPTPYVAPVSSQLSLPKHANDRDPIQMWRGLAIAASAVAVLSLGSHWIPTSDPIQIAQAPQTNGDQRYLALLSGETASPLVAIVYNPLTGEVVARFSNVDVPDDGDLQLWLIRDGAAAPVSLGVLERTTQGAVELSIPEALTMQTDLLAVSLEAKGGSRSAGPEGPVLYTGRVSALK